MAVPQTRKKRAVNPTAILMFSSLTTDGAKSTLDALDAGAVDFLPKRFEDISNDRDEARRVLCERVRAVGTKRRPVARVTTARPAPVTTRANVSTASPAKNVTPARRVKRASLTKGKTKLVAIGTPTRGPVAVQNVLKQLPANFPVPIILIQHMPGSFTKAFADRMNNACASNIREAQDGDELKPGLALLAPGGQQMIVEKRGGHCDVKITDRETNKNKKPRDNVTF